MFIFRLIPNISDEFLTAYRLATILSQKTLVGISPVPSSNSMPLFDPDFLSIFSNDVSPTSTSIWCGLPNGYLATSEENLAYITEWRENIYYYNTLNIMDKYWIMSDPEFPYPFLPEPITESKGIFLYALPSIRRNIWDTIEAWMISESQEPLKIFAPFQDPYIYKKKISDLREKHKSQKKCFLTTPNVFSPEDLNKEIAKSKYILDIFNYKGISYPSVIANASGIPSICGDNVFPEGSIIVSADSREKCKDGGRLTGEIYSVYNIDNIANALSMLDFEEDIIYDNTSAIFDIFI